MLSIDAWLDEKPYKEAYDGAIHPKVSSRSTHAIVAGELYAALRAWGSATGSTGVEWRVHLAPGITLVPDVAYFARGRLARLVGEEREKPPFAPDIAVEVRSPGDSDRHVKRKSELYLRHGAALVLDVDPATRTIEARSVTGSRMFRAGETVEHDEFPGLAVAVHDVFAPLDGL